MVEHSVAVNDEIDNGEVDYLKALQSAKFDHEQKSGECSVEQAVDSGGQFS